MCQIQAYLSKQKKTWYLTLKVFVLNSPTLVWPGDNQNTTKWMVKKVFVYFYKYYDICNIVLYFNQGVVLCPVSLKS